MAEKDPAHGFEKGRKENADAQKAHRHCFIAEIGALDEPGE
jgi:hypothetical protein